MTEATPLTLQFELSLADYQAMSRQLYARKPIQSVANMLLVWLVMMIVVSFGTWIYPGMGFVWGMLAGILLVVANALRTYLRLRPMPNGALLCQYLVQLSDDRIHLETPGWTTDMLWKGVLSVEETPKHCFLRIDSIAAYVIPKRAFASDESAHQFVAFARERVAAGRRG
jgi:hypothetical protein